MGLHQLVNKRDKKTERSDDKKEKEKEKDIEESKIVGGNNICREGGEALYCSHTIPI